MPGTTLKRKSDDANVSEFIRATFKKRECNRFVRDMNQLETWSCECGRTRDIHSSEAIDNEFNQRELLTKVFPTDAFGKLNFVEDEEEYFDWKTKLKNIRYVRLDCDTDANKILDLFHYWNMAIPDVICSVLSDSDIDNDAGKGHNVIESKINESIQNIRKAICSSFVEAAASTNAWIITGGLNKGVDQLIGNEVKHRMANWEKIPQAVLGICQWGCLAKKQYLLNDSSGSDFCESDNNPTGLSLNQHHTHFLLADDGTQKRSNCECILRQAVELALMKVKTNGIPLIYILIGGGVNAFRIVERALANRIPVIIAMGTGGAADIISGAVTSKDGATLDYLPEIAERMFHGLEELLIAESISASVVCDVIATMKVEIKLEPFLEIVEFLDKTAVYDRDPRQFISDIAKLRKAETNELLVEIKDLLISKQTPSNSSSYSDVDAEVYSGNHMRAVFQQMLVVKGIGRQIAEKVLENLEPNVLNEMLAKSKLVSSGLKAIRTHSQTDLLIKFNINSRQQKTFIIETLMKVNWTQPNDLYMLVADWDNEIFFKQLLLENWMRREHENVFRKLLDKGKTKYVKMMMEHIGNCNWLTKPEGPLKKDLKKNKLCENLLRKLSDQKSDTDNEDIRHIIKAKMLFIWCVQKQMPETAMLFWEQGQDCLAMALVAYSESKKQKEALVNMKGYDDMEQQVQFFAKVALDFVRKCHSDNPEKTYRLLFDEVEDIGDQQPLKIAVSANFEAFCFADQVQDMLSVIWSKGIENYRECKYIPVILSIACPLLAPALLRIDSKDKKQKSETAQRCPVVGSYLRKCSKFVKTPLVKLSYSLISFIAYLTLFSIVLLTNFRAKISPSEIAVSIWTFILLIQEIRQSRVDKDEYWSNEWNYFDIVALTLYIIGFVLRMIYHGDPSICPDCLYVARIVLAFSLLVFFFRTLQYLSIYESLGPRIYMIRQLVADLVGFMLILAVFIAAYGVVSNVILYPNQPLNAQLLNDVFYDSWWSVIQQFNREDASGLNCKKDNPNANITAAYCSSTVFNDDIDYESCKENRCPANVWIVSVLLALYSLITCVMLLNVLIAMFNTTFTTIDEKQKEVSKMQRFRLISEYCDHLMVPPPLCAITYPYIIIEYLYKRYKDRREHDGHSQGYRLTEPIPSSHNYSVTVDVEGGPDVGDSGRLRSSSKASDRREDVKDSQPSSSTLCAMEDVEGGEYWERSSSLNSLPKASDQSGDGYQYMACSLTFDEKNERGGETYGVESMPLKLSVPFDPRDDQNCVQSCSLNLYHKTDSETGINVEESMPFKRSPYSSAENRKSQLKDWERSMVTEYYKENKGKNG